MGGEVFVCFAVAVVVFAITDVFGRNDLSLAGTKTGSIVFADFLTRFADADFGCSGIRSVAGITGFGFTGTALADIGDAGGTRCTGLLLTPDKASLFVLCAFPCIPGVFAPGRAHCTFWFGAVEG